MQVLKDLQNEHLTKSKNVLRLKFLVTDSFADKWPGNVLQNSLRPAKGKQF